ncbi:hypothetical protein BHE74_00038595 [Ensete ventricosum]|nr:hypothetical protein GW17_00045959 [Ensete ventricosum]RWW54801.1 hypothetical protein BHE74_00038595 [Ensete ventricosum]RZS18316.1 hypothetical protein BHM03_00050560 [Ensete ventricosum]
MAVASSANHHHLLLRSHPRRVPSPGTPFLRRNLIPALSTSSRRDLAPVIRSSFAAAYVASSNSPPLVDQPGGKMVVELVGAFNELTGRMDGALSTTSSSRLLFRALKLSIPLLQALPLAPDGRPPLSRALSVACLLADLQVCICTSVIF